MVDPNNPCKVKAPTVRVQPRRSVVRGDDSGLADCGGQDFPALMSILCAVPAGSKVKQTGKVKLWVQNGKLTCCVTYPAQRAVTFLTIADVRDVLAEIEAHVANEGLEWKEDNYA